MKTFFSNIFYNLAGIAATIFGPFVALFGLITGRQFRHFNFQSCPAVAIMTVFYVFSCIAAGLWYALR